MPLLNTVIFDMDGLLIDSEPLWNEAADDLLQEHGMKLTDAQYKITQGLRTQEFLHHWFNYFNLPLQHLDAATEQITDLVVQKVRDKAKVMDGVEYIIDFFLQRQFKIGLATSSPRKLIDAVLEKLGIGKVLQAIASAEHLVHGKPHPQVYLDCATALQSHPTQCICFEDSFYGMVAVKAARMTCVQVPAYDQLNDPRWNAADLKLSSLRNFSALHLEGLMR